MAAVVGDALVVHAGATLHSGHYYCAVRAASYARSECREMGTGRLALRESLPPGDERSIEDNLRVAVQGGKNERQQARFNLIRQLVENIDAQADERDAPYGVPENFADQLEVASRELDDDPEGRLVVANPEAGLAGERFSQLHLHLR